MCDVTFEKDEIVVRVLVQAPAIHQVPRRMRIVAVRRNLFAALHADGVGTASIKKLRAALSGPEVARLSLSEKEVAAGAGEDRIAAFLAAFGKA